MKESITDRYIGIGTGVGVALGLILKIALDSLAGLVIGICLGVFGGFMMAAIKVSQKSDTEKKGKNLYFWFWRGCVVGVVLGILGMVYYLIANG